MKEKELVTDIKEAIIRAKQGGSTDHAVSALLKVDRGTVSRVFKRFRELKSVANIPRSGRPRESNESNDLTSVEIVKDDPKKTATDVTKYANERLKLGITTRTARHILKRANLPAAKLSKKPWISKKNVKPRLKFARAYLDCTSSCSQWGYLLATDAELDHLTADYLGSMDNRPFVTTTPSMYQILAKTMEIFGVGSTAGLWSNQDIRRIHVPLNSNCT
uniref:Transposase Tc1-like domain-containing protein n=1 Tax=Ditylenchus dipsaci TaxID=166011 RepID=A0A915CX24_9BILA